jgi:hypothetical protein
VDVARTVFQGIRAVLDDQVPEARRRAALVRLRRYAGLDAGETPLAVLARQRIEERLSVPELQAPPRMEIEKNLGTSGFYLDGIGKLFARYAIAGYEEPFVRLREQVKDYDAFVRASVLPRARADFRLPPELYAFRLRAYGVDIPAAALAERARVAFMEIRNEMKTLAPLVAQQKGFASTDYHDVLRELKKDQIVGDAILPHYEKRLAELEEIIRREGVVTLPARKARIRLASEAESTQIPAPNMHVPRLIGNTGEQGEFVLPLNVPTGGPGEAQSLRRFDDFTFAAASWTLTAHEARPGHELQFASMLEKGVSIARGVFAFNSVNVEGWGLYAEAEMKPYFPLDGQLIGLQHRLMRAARAFLDPELQMGRIEPEQAVSFLQQEVGLSEAMARQEVERYTFRSPGQATAYFYGYTRLLRLRSEVELATGARFDRRRYHDFILAQGLLPPDALARIVLAEFVPAAAGKAHAEEAPGRAGSGGQPAAPQP